MFATAFAQLTGLLEKRFVANALLPALSFTTVGAAIALVPFGVGAVADAWDRQTTLVQAGLVVLVLTWLYLLGLVLASQTFTIVQLFEGYWPRPAVRFAAPAVAWHRRRRTSLLADDVRYAEGWTEYPLEGDVLPTRLGNVLLSGESYSLERYNVDAVLVWPRLYQLVPAAALDPLAQSRSSMEQNLILSVLSAVLAVVGGLYLALFPIHLAWCMGVFGAGVVLAVVFYRSAVGHAVVYSGQIRAIFDLYRLKVLGAMAFGTPANREEECKLWEKAHEVIYRNAPPSESDWNYVTNPERSEHT